MHANHYFISQSKKNFLRIESIQPIRGSIFDCRGKPIATNRPIYDIYWNPTGNKLLTLEQKHTLSTLNTLLKKPLSEETMQEIIIAERLHRKKKIASDISLNQLCKISEQIPNNSNIQIQTHVKRYYPYNSWASHTIGYLGNKQFEQIGKMGLEKLFEESLRGMQGTQMNAINSYGKQITQSELQEALSGKDIYTTLDMQMQSIAEKVFPQEHAGALIVMNPKNGALLSIVSRPQFDPEIFLDPITYSVWHKLQENHTFINRAFTAYPPGSIFKLVTISAALEHGLVDPQATWHCSGYSTFVKRKYWCAQRHGHGTLSTKEAVAKSCNILFFDIGKQIDVDLLAEYAYKFGLGNSTGLIFSEQKGLIPSRFWKETVKGEKWWPGETLSVSIGQSFLLTTPIQIARMIGSIFTGYLVKPRLLQDEPIITEPLEIQPSTIDFLKRSMKSVIRRGTGKRINTIKDISIYAKTSTAQMSGLEKRHEGTVYFEHGWFASYFAYKNYDPLVLIILVEHAGTSQVATTIAKHFIIEYKDMMKKNSENNET